MKRRELKKEKTVERKIRRKKVDRKKRKERQ